MTTLRDAVTALAADLAKPVRRPPAHREPYDRGRCRGEDETRYCVAHDLRRILDDRTLEES